jgi:hypothetical protein
VRGLVAQAHHTVSSTSDGKPGFSSKVACLGRAEEFGRSSGFMERIAGTHLTGVSPGSISRSEQPLQDLRDLEHGAVVERGDVRLKARQRRPMRIEGALCRTTPCR